MTDKQKNQFDLINNSLWLLVKGYVTDDKPYKSIMSETFRLFMTYDVEKNKFSDEWWEEVTKKFMDYPQLYKDTKLKDFAGDLGIGFCNYWEREKKKPVDYVDFYNCISKAFIREWERLKT